jgi:hypothetical protein
MSSPDASTSYQPLLHEDRQASNSNTHDRSVEDGHPRTGRFRAVYTVCQQRVQKFLSSRSQHYTVLGLVSLDLLGIFADIIINLYQCDEKHTDPKWDDVRNGLGTAGLVFSCLFLVELLASIWAFGWRFVSISMSPFSISSEHVQN